MAARKRTTKKYKKGPFGNVYLEWPISEYPQPERSMGWYIFMIVLAIFLVIYSIFTANFLFALIIILAAFIVLLKIFEQPRQLNFQITDRGIIIGNQYIRYEDIRTFWLVYDPPAIKKVFFSLKSLMPDISVNLDKINPVALRKRLLKTLEEDLEREHQSIDDQLETLLKL
jgi:hypothetical protein